MGYKKRHFRLDIGFDLAILIALFLILIMTNFMGRNLSGSSFAKYIQNDSEITSYCCDYPQVPGSEGSGMTSDGIPAPEEPAYLVLPCIIKPDNSEKRSNEERYFNQDKRLSAFKLNKRCCLATSSSKISTTLARQFTLVGAKPSGTS